LYEKYVLLIDKRPPTLPIALPAGHVWKTILAVVGIGFVCGLLWLLH
jgi:hypothetical protein